jgi:hypothetical protein
MILEPVLLLAGEYDAGLPLRNALLAMFGRPIRRADR